MGLDAKFVEQIKAAVLEDKTPEILEVIEQTCKSESDRLMHIWHADERSKPPSETKTLSDILSRDRDNEVTPRWLWWSFFVSHFDYMIRNLREQLAQRDMTRGQIDAVRKQVAIDARRRELEALERSA